MDTIAPCLENVLATIGPQDEILIVDDGSRAPTRKAIESFCGDVPRTRQCETRRVEAAGCDDGTMATRSALPSCRRSVRRRVFERRRVES